MEDIFDLPSVKRGSELRTGNYKLLISLTIIISFLHQFNELWERKSFRPVSGTPQVQHLSEIGCSMDLPQILHQAIILPFFQQRTQSNNIIILTLLTHNHSRYTAYTTHLHFTMIRKSIALLALVLASADAFKFMSNWQPPKILTDEQKVKMADMEERFGDKSKFYARYLVEYCYT